MSLCKRCGKHEALVCASCTVDLTEYATDAKPVSGDVMPKVDGKSFRCECGCNVFRWLSANRMRCNSCAAVYEAIKA